MTNHRNISDEAQSLLAEIVNNCNGESEPVFDASQKEQAAERANIPTNALNKAVDEFVRKGIAKSNLGATQLMFDSTEVENFRREYPDES